jgi:hypothetical protein
LKAGIGLSLLISFPLLSVHVSRRYHPDHGSILPEGKSDMQQPILGCLSQLMEALLCFTMPFILDNDQWIVEEDTFGFGLTDVMLIRAFAAIAIVPVKTRDLVKVDHCVYAQYIQNETSMQYELDALRTPVAVLGLADGSSASS